MEPKLTCKYSSSILDQSKLYTNQYAVGTVLCDPTKMYIIGADFASPPDDKVELKSARKHQRLSFVI
jgi:hypothetical protein